MNKKVLFITDSLEDLDLKKDTSILMMEESIKLGFDVYQCLVEDLYAENSEVIVFAKKITTVSTSEIKFEDSSTHSIKTFEYSLRVLGGLLGAYSLSGDPRLYAAARNAADSILEGPFQASPSIIPRPFNVLAPSTSSFNDCSWLWDWKAAIQRLYRSIYSMARNTFTHEHQTNSLAGFGSFAIEFSFI